MARRRSRSMVYGVSAVVHLALGAALFLAVRNKAWVREIIPIVLREKTTVDAPPKPAESPPKPPARQTQQRRASESASQASTSVAATSKSFPDFGLVLDSSASDGVEVGSGQFEGSKPSESTAQPKPKVLSQRTETSCTEEVVKPRVIQRMRPSYTMNAHRAGVEGPVRLALTVDDHGGVTSVRLLRGLGYGLDEEAISAAWRFRFVPASLCGKPISASFALIVRFLASKPW